MAEHRRDRAVAKLTKAGDEERVFHEESQCSQCSPREPPALEVSRRWEAYHRKGQLNAPCDKANRMYPNPLTCLEGAGPTCVRALDCGAFRASTLDGSCASNTPPQRHARASTGTKLALTPTCQAPAAFRARWGLWLRLPHTQRGAGGGVGWNWTLLLQRGR
jgi:hypothetical protein